ncbi:histidine kinase [Streptomyces phaeochromogenes]|uniref:sensor histidine kinase n=1 Tax=Streptomyces phaeochromogenes TaxID=1923 RepID=UPI0038682BAD
MPRLRWPAAPLLVTVATAWWGSLLLPMLAVALYDLAVDRRARVAVACAVAALSANLLGYRATSLWTGQSYASTVFLPVLAVLVGLWLGNRRRLLQALAADVEHLRIEAQLREEAARIAERSRIASEMHDALAHRLSLITLHTGVLATTSDTLPAPVAERLGLLRTTSGAHILGLDEANKTMLRSFAASSTAAHKYFPVWALNFDAKTYLSIDYKSPDNYVREVPAVFELVEKAGQAYLWTGDQSYVDDPTMWNFYRHSTEEFIDLHNSAKPNGKVKVAEGTGNGIFAGAASYNEQDGDGLAEAGDGIASQYQAYLALATLARGKGDTALARKYDRSAAELKAYFNDEWSGSGSGADMVRAYTTSNTPVTGWGKENSVFVPMKQILDPGPRNNAYLDYIQEQELGPDGSPNIESTTYLPDMFFKNNRNDTAWTWMKKIYGQRELQHVNSSQGPNGDYPEVSFTLVSQTVEGLMGIAPDAANRTVTTQSRLPSGMKWLRAADVPIGTSTITVRHDGATKTKLTNNARRGAYRWEARFPGVHKKIEVNGVPQRVRTKTVGGVTYTYATPTVRAGATAVVRVTD